MPFTKGDPNINRTGKTNPAIKMLREALEEEGLSRGKPFYKLVAEIAFKDKQVMIAVLKKFVPDMTKTEVIGEGLGTKVIIVKDKQPNVASDSRSITIPEKVS